MGGILRRNARAISVFSFAPCRIRRAIVGAGHGGAGSLSGAVCAKRLMGFADCRSVGAAVAAGPPGRAPRLAFHPGSHIDRSRVRGSTGFRHWHLPRGNRAVRDQENAPTLFGVAGRHSIGSLRFFRLCNVGSVVRKHVGNGDGRIPARRRIDLGRNGFTVRGFDFRRSTGCGSVRRKGSRPRPGCESLLHDVAGAGSACRGGNVRRWRSDWPVRWGKHSRC
jgi:hypothetical protein